MPFWQTSHHLCKRKWNVFAQSPRKTKNYIFFKNKCNSCKCFSGHVECSLDKPFHPINTFLPDIPKSTDGHRENLRKYTFFPKHFFNNVFLLKNILWTSRMQSRKTVQYFFSKAWKLFAENSKIEIKLKTFSEKISPNLLLDTSMPFWHPCWNHCQKFEHSLLNVKNCLKSYICTKHWFFIKIFI